jgi:hypothetical protein
MALVPVLTFVWGFAALAASSALTTAQSGTVDIPFWSIFTVSIGDALLLPLVNLELALIFRATLRRGIGARDWTWIRQWSAAAVAVGLASASLSHYAWMTDPFTDFLSVRPAELTFGGWWHFGFSVVQTTALVMFVPLWTLAVDSGDAATQRRAEWTWWLLLAFGALMIANLVYQVSFVIPEMEISGIASAGQFTLIPILAALAARSYVERRRTRHQKQGST